MLWCTPAAGNEDALVPRWSSSLTRSRFGDFLGWFLQTAPLGPLKWNKFLDAQ
jgi:hypothetical protein